jgi:hypothetical protein
LLGKKAEVNVTRSDGISAVMAAAVGAHKECVRILVEAVSAAYKHSTPLTGCAAVCTATCCITTVAYYHDRRAGAYGYAVAQLFRVVYVRYVRTKHTPYSYEHNHS